MWQIGGFYSSTGIIGNPLSVTGANLLLAGETDGFAIDATTANGTVSVKDTGTPANNLNNVAINSSNLTQSGTSPKYVIWNDGTIHTISAGLVAQEYDSAQAKYGILIEPAATNIIIENESFTTTGGAWIYGLGLTQTSTNNTAPDGNATGSLFTPDATTDYHVIACKDTTIDLTTTGAASVFCKKGGGRYFQLNAFRNGGAFPLFAAVFDFDTVTTVASTGVNGGTFTSSSMTPIGNGWYRVVITGNTGTSGQHRINIGPSDGSAMSTTWAAAGTETVYMWGAQLETGPVATSYIPTAGTTVTRAADVVKVAKTTFPWSDTNGSIYAKYKPFNVGSGNRYVWQAYKDANNHISLLGITANPTLENTQASTQDVALDAGTLVANTLTRVSGAYKANDFDVSQDGGAVQSDGVSTLTTGYTDLYIGTKGSATTEELNGYIYQLLYVPYQRQTVNGDIDTWKNTA